MTSPDIRAGIALLIAAMSAEGISRIHNIEQIDRGYQNIEGRSECYRRAELHEYDKKRRSI